MKNYNYGVLLYSPKEIWEYTRSKDFDGVPHQCLFLEDKEVSDYPRWLGGIYLPDDDCVVCLECGGRIEVEDLAMMFLFNEWADISNDIWDGAPTDLDEKAKAAGYQIGDDE